MSALFSPRELIGSLRHPRNVGVAMLLWSIAILGGAHIFERFGGLAPCPLCLEQRAPWWGLIGIGALLLALPMVPRIPGRALIGLFAFAAVLAVYGGYLGAYHAGIEWEWWKGPPECTSPPADFSGALGDLNKVAVVSCDKAPWTLFGLSLAGYNVLASLAALALAVLGGAELFRMNRVLAPLTKGIAALHGSMRGEKG